MILNPAHVLLLLSCSVLVPSYALAGSEATLEKENPVSVTADTASATSTSFLKQREAIDQLNKMMSIHPIDQLNKMMSSRPKSSERGSVEVRGSLRGEKKKKSNDNSAERVYHYFNSAEDAKAMDVSKLSVMTVDEMNGDSHVEKTFFDQELELTYGLYKKVENAKFGGLCMQFNNTDAAGGIWPVETGACDSNNEDQWWRLYNDTTIKPDKDANKCIDGGFSEYLSKWFVFTASCNGSNNQKWKDTKNSDKSFTDVNEANGLALGLNENSYYWLTMEPTEAAPATGWFWSE